MQLSLTEDQAMLEKTATSFVAEHSPVARLRALRDAKDELGYSPELWKQMAELGWLAIPFAERDGGMGLGLAGAIIVSEALGRGLAAEPYVPQVVLAGSVLAQGSSSQRTQWLTPLIEGEQHVALAHQEAGARYRATRVTTLAQRAGSGYRITGTKLQVQGGFGADAFIVTARSSGDDDAREGITTFLVPANTRGLKVTRQWRVDSRNAALVELDGVEVSDQAVLGTVDRGAPVIESAIDRATVALCGEMLGAMSEAFSRTVAYLKERKQFGVAIGTFQALKHRAARMFIELELARSATLSAARTLDDAQNDEIACALAVSIAKARCSDAYQLIANEAVQMHGGIGMTDEHEIGFFMKHARVCELTYGDAAFHRERFAAVSGY